MLQNIKTMIQITIKESSPEANAFIAFVKTLKFVKVQEIEDTYDPKFVKMVLKSAASKKRYKVDTDDIWGSLGLK